MWQAASIILGTTAKKQFRSHLNFHFIILYSIGMSSMLNSELQSTTSPKALRWVSGLPPKAKPSDRDPGMHCRGLWTLTKWTLTKWSDIENAYTQPLSAHSLWVNRPHQQTGRFPKSIIPHFTSSSSKPAFHVWESSCYTGTWWWEYRRWGQETWVQCQHCSLVAVWY